MVNAGKLYRNDEAQFVTGVNYRLLGVNYEGVTGELVPETYGSLNESEEYIVELDDSRKFRCSLKKNVNRPTVGLPPRFTYHFVGA